MKLWNLMLILSMILGCSRPDLFIGTGGRYNAGREEVSKQRGANIDKAIVNLEAVAREDPTYKDTLTLLGRAYYRRERYNDAKLILQRALVVNQKDEIAWLILGVTQLRLGENDAGLQSIRGGLTLLSKANQEGYRGYEVWDRGGTVKIAVRRAVIDAQKGLDAGNKDALIRSIETTLASIDREEFHQHIERNQVIRDQY
jgi:tetratricopeptide (TPR) repeat protein